MEYFFGMYHLPESGSDIISKIESLLYSTRCEGVRVVTCQKIKGDTYKIPLNSGNRPAQCKKIILQAEIIETNFPNQSYYFIVDSIILEKAYSSLNTFISKIQLSFNDSERSLMPQKILEFEDLILFNFSKIS